MRKIVLLVLIVFLCFTFSAGAQESQDSLEAWMQAFSDLTNLNNIGLTVFPILELSPGGQRSNMGNAFTALANDISFFESNPAASSTLEFTELAFFHRDLISDLNLDSVFFTQRDKDLGYGFGLKFLHFEFTSIDERGNQLASATPTEILFTANIAYNLFSSYDFSGLALGANVKLAYRGIPRELYTHVLDPDAYPQDLVGIIFDIGLLSRFNFLKLYSGRDKNFSVGLGLINLGPAVREEPLPTELRFGIAYKPFSFLTIAADLNYLMNLLDLSRSEGLGFATGLDLRFVDFFGIQGGLELRGNNPRLTIGSTLDLEPVSFHITYTIDLSTSSRSLDNFSVGAILNFGDLGRAEMQKEIDEIYIAALLALSEGEFERVIELCDQIIDPETGLDPGFTPAYRTRSIAVATIEREESLIDFERNREEIGPSAEPE